MNNDMIKSKFSTRLALLGVFSLISATAALASSNLEYLRCVDKSTGFEVRIASACPMPTGNPSDFGVKFVNDEANSVISTYKGGKLKSEATYSCSGIWTEDSAFFSTRFQKGEEMVIFEIGEGILRLSMYATPDDADRGKALTQIDGNCWYE